MTVEQYSAKFAKLSKFASILIPNEETKAKKSFYCLQPHIRGKIILFEIKEYSKMVHMAMIAKRSMKEVAACYAQRKRLMSQVMYPLKRQAVGGIFGVTSKKSVPMSYGNQKTSCIKCEKQHLGECRVGTGLCYQCGRPGHIWRDCPMAAVVSRSPQGSRYQPRQPAQARVYSLTPRNAEAEENNADIVTVGRMWLTLRLL